MTILHRIDFTVYLHLSLLQIDLMEKHSMLQTILRMPAYQLSLQLPHHHTDGLTHFRSQLRLYGIRNIFIP